MVTEERMSQMEWRQQQSDWRMQLFQDAMMDMGLRVGRIERTMWAMQDDIAELKVGQQQHWRLLLAMAKHMEIDLSDLESPPDSN